MHFYLTATWLPRIVTFSFLLQLNTHFPRGTTRPLFAPVPAFHKATQKPFRSAVSTTSKKANHKRFKCKDENEITVLLLAQFKKVNVSLIKQKIPVYCKKKMFVFFQKQGRWCALHVCIAWKIYYHEQLKVLKSHKPANDTLSL